jgi:hypothetical protein
MQHCKKAIFIDETTGDHLLWKNISAWEGTEAPRILFNTISDISLKQAGLINEALTFRGIDIFSLYEGKWITLTWPTWFSELAAVDDFVRVHQNDCIVLHHPSLFMQAVSSCIKARYPKLQIHCTGERLPVVHLGMIDTLRNVSWRTLRYGRDWVRATQRRKPVPTVLPSGQWAFFPWSPKIAPNILPIADACARRWDGKAVFAGWNRYSPIPLKEGEMWNCVGSDISSSLVTEAWRAGKMLQDQWSQVLRSSCLDVLGDWYNWDLRPLVIPFLTAAVHNLYPVLLNILCVEAWCHRKRIEAVIVPQDGGESVRSVIAGARLADVPSFSIQYGFATDNPEIGEPFEDVLFLQGSRTAKCYLRRGASAKKLAVVGTTAYDRLTMLQGQRDGIRRELAQRFDLNPKMLWIVVATWHVQSVYPRSVKEEELSLVAQAISEFPGVQLLFKLHPSDKEFGKLEKALAGRYGLSARVIDNVEMNEKLLLAADTVICNYSTLATMAIVAKTPVVIVDMSGMQKPPHRAYVDEGVAMFADNRKSLQVALSEVFAGREIFWMTRMQAWNDFIKARLYRADNHAADRICSTISSWLNERTLS